MNEGIDRDEDLQEPVGNPANEVRGDHCENDARDFPVRAFFEFGFVFVTNTIESNENENVECGDHRDGQEKAQDERIISEDDLRRNGEDD